MSRFSCLFGFDEWTAEYRVVAAAGGTPVATGTDAAICCWRTLNAILQGGT